MVEVFKRPGSPFWYAYLKDPRSPDGLLRRSTKRRLQREAREVAEALQREIDAELLYTTADPGGLRWLDAMTAFIDGADLKPSSIKGYGSLSNVVFTNLGDFSLAGLTQDRIREFCQERRKDEVTDQTIRNCLSLMSSVYQFAIDHDLEGGPEANPLATFDRSFLRASRPVDRHLRPSQFERLLKACPSEVDQRIITVLVGTGMRSSELTNLYWGEVDFKRKVIEFGNVDPMRTKTGRSRRIPMLKPVEDALTAQFTAQSVVGRKPDRLVFPNTRDPLTPRPGFRYLTLELRERTGIKTFTIHGLRHTFASWCLQQGLDPVTIRLALGHSTLSTTNRYAHHVPDSAMAQIRRLDLPFTAQTTAHSNGLKNRRSRKST